MTWYFPTLRRLFLWWQRKVNGFVLVDRITGHRVFIFRCTHFDEETRSCTCYESRPGLCRDYPRVLLFQPNPEFLPGCGCRPVDVTAPKLLAELESQSLEPEQMAKLKKELYLD